jgi:tRNA splicing endonuclease
LFIKVQHFFVNYINLSNYVYVKGDPVQVHAQYMVTCQLPHEAISPLILISMSRVATAAHKLLLLATLDDSEESDVLVLQTLSWVA